MEELKDKMLYYAVFQKQEIGFGIDYPIFEKLFSFGNTTEEAYEIAKSYETFVSECFFIGSALDNNTAIIEKSLHETILFSGNSSSLILTNHYQSDSLKNSKLNLESINEGSTVYRYKRVQQLIENIDSIDYIKMASILRNQKGLDDKDIGMGNEKAINQLICHHSIIFMPQEKLVWVSEYPYQIGKYVAYNLNKIFNDTFDIKLANYINEKNLTIPDDNFLKSNSYKQFSLYKNESQLIKSSIVGKTDFVLSNEKIKKYLNLNQEYYYSYYLVAEYYRSRENYKSAIRYYNIALKKEIPREVDKKQIIDALVNVKKLMD